MAARGLGAAHRAGSVEGAPLVRRPRPAPGPSPSGGPRRAGLARRWAGLARRIGEEAGAETVEFVGMFPLVIMTVALVWQFMLVGYTAIVAAGAAREAARAAALGASVDEAIDRSRQAVEISYELQRADGVSTVRVRASIPSVPIPLLERISLPAVIVSASMMDEARFR